MTSHVTHSQKASTRSHERERSFTIEQFQALVASALDIQRVPDSDLAFSFGGDAFPPSTCLTHSRRSNGARSIRSVTLTRLKGAFAKKTEPTDASLSVPPESRRVASSSTPSFAIPSFGENYQRSAISVQTPSDPSSLPATSLAPIGSYDGFENRSCVENFHAPDVRLERKKYSNARSFLNLKPLVIPELSRKASRKLFSSGTLPTPPSEPSSISSNSSPTVDSSYTDTDALRSFFDDSGYEEDLHALNAVKKSKTSLRSLFLSSQHGNIKGRSVVPSAHGVDKVFLPTPATENRPLTQYKETMPAKDSFYTHENVSFDRGSLFYTPPADEQSLSDVSDMHQACKKARSKDEARARRASNLIIGASSSDRKNASRASRNSPPPYPSPTSPLPPTPDLSAMSTLASSSHGQISPRVPDGVGDASEDSIDSTEIRSWRMPNLEQQASATSTSSSAQAYALGRPSRGSIRERLGLGPRLHLHVPTPAEFLSGSSKMPKSRERLSSESTIRAHRPPSRTDSPKLPLQRLTSASLVSFKSIATITAAGKGTGEEAFCFVRREEALAVDRAFTPEDDPFAADPLTPITPITPVFETQSTKTDKYRSFMPLGNASSTSVSPELPICVLPSWHYRLGSNSNKSSPALTPSPPHHDHPRSTPRRSRLSAVPANARYKQFPSSVYDGQKPKCTLPSDPSNLSVNQLDLNQAIATVQNYRKLQQEDLNEREHECEECDSQVVGHSESRPHSPFPLLFQEANAMRTVQAAAARDSRRSGVSSAILKVTSECSAKCIPTTQPAGRPVESCRIRHGECIEEPRSLSAKDVDAFGEAASNFTPDYSSREIVSPTAWLLELDDYDDSLKNTLEDDTPTGGSNILALDLHSGTPIHGRYGEGRKLYDRPTNLEGNNYGHSSPLRVFHPAESEADNQVVVDDEYGKVYHPVAPESQYIRASSAPRSLKYLIRSPEKNFGLAASEYRDYRRSNNNSSHSNGLTNSQSRAIVEQCRQPSGYKNSVPVGSPCSYKPPKSVSSHQLKQRSRSTTSLASVGGFSVRTSRTAYYSARSMVSRGSDQSTFSFPHSRQVGPSSREGSIHSTSSSRSPDSSGDHGCRPSAVHLDSDSSRVSPATSNMGSPVSRDF